MKRVTKTKQGITAPADPYAEQSRLQTLLDENRAQVRRLESEYQTAVREAVSALTEAAQKSARSRAQEIMTEIGGLKVDADGLGLLLADAEAEIEARAQGHLEDLVSQAEASIAALPPAREKAERDVGAAISAIEALQLIDSYFKPGDFGYQYTGKFSRLLAERFEAFMVLMRTKGFLLEGRLRTKDFLFSLHPAECPECPLGQNQDGHEAVKVVEAAEESLMSLALSTGAALASIEAVKDFKSSFDKEPLTWQLHSALKGTPKRSSPFYNQLMGIRQGYISNRGFTVYAATKPPSL